MGRANYLLGLIVLSFVACDVTPVVRVRDHGDGCDLTVRHSPKDQDYLYYGDTLPMRMIGKAEFKEYLLRVKANDTVYTVRVPSGREVELRPTKMGAFLIHSVKFGGDPSWTWTIADRAQRHGLKRNGKVHELWSLSGPYGYVIDLR